MYLSETIMFVTILTHVYAAPAMGQTLLIRFTNIDTFNLHDNCVRYVPLFYSHFTNEENKAQQRSVTCLWCTRWQVAKPGRE